MSIVEQQALVAPGTWNVDPAHSSVEFSISYLAIATIRGRVGSFAGTIVGGERPSITGQVDVSTVTTFHEQRDAHLQTPDFFDAERHPQATFQSTEVTSENGQLVVRGSLTLRGRTNAVELRGAAAGPTTDPWGKQRIGLELEGAIDRNEFGIGESFNEPLPTGTLLLAKQVRLAVSLVAVEAE